MKTSKLVLGLIFSFILSVAMAQQEDDDQKPQVRSVFGKHRVNSGGYGAISNKFTSLDGQYANMVEVYGGWYINQWFLLGLSGAAVTNDIPVPSECSAIPGENLSYMYGQFGLKTEYVISSNNAFHIAFDLMTGTGFTAQYDRYYYREGATYRNMPYQEDWFFVAEPGIQLEVNIFKWMRFSPGYSYRLVYGSNAEGLSDEKLSGHSFNLALKFGKF